jgi:hypothetical protein
MAVKKEPLSGDPTLPPSSGSVLIIPLVAPFASRPAIWEFHIGGRALSHNVVAEIVEFAYQNDARLFL